MLRVELGTELCNQIELSLQEIDVLRPLAIAEPDGVDVPSVASRRLSREELVRAAKIAVPTKPANGPKRPPHAAVRNTGLNGCSAVAHSLHHLTHGIPTRRPFHPAKTANILASESTPIWVVRGAQSGSLGGRRPSVKSALV
jgi:hypothetical protein